MKLISLYIDRYLMLRDLTVRFDRHGRLPMGKYALDFLVGLNGSGKSTFLRALAQIVTDLHANRPTPFNYRLEYVITRADRQLRVQITRQRPHLTMTVYNAEDGAPLLDAAPVDAVYLPERVIVYTTGSLTAWDVLAAQLAYTTEERDAAEELLADPVKRSIAELPGHLPRLDYALTDNAQSPLLLLRESRLPLIALTGLLASLQAESSLLGDVLQSLRLAGLRAFSLRLRLHQALSDYDLFEQLSPHATRHVQQGSDHLLVFELPEGREAQQAFVQQLWADYATPLAFYDALDQLCEPLATGEPTLQQLNIFLERALVVDEEESDGTSRLLLFDWMSDGERSFLSRMAMLAMLQTENSLILLDEPEVHFNDYWKREIVKLIDAVMRDHANHLLIVSHSSIGLSDVASAQVTVMSRSEDGFAIAHPPTIKTFGADPSEIMVVVFRARLSTGAYAADLLETAVESGEREEIVRFLEAVGPGMWLFQLRRRLEDFDASSPESA